MAGSYVLGVGGMLSLPKIPRTSACAGKRGNSARPAGLRGRRSRSVRGRKTLTGGRKSRKYGVDVEAAAGKSNFEEKSHNEGVPLSPETSARVPNSRNKLTQSTEPKENKESHENDSPKTRYARKRVSRITQRDVPEIAQRSYSVVRRQSRGATNLDSSTSKLVSSGGFGHKAGAVSIVKSDGGAIPGLSLAKVHFSIQFHTDFGQTLKIIGSHKNLGNWVVSDSPVLRWGEGDLWSAVVELPSGGVYEYKYVVVADNGVTPIYWQTGNNSVLAVKSSESEVEVFDNWQGHPGASVISGSKVMTREKRLLAWASDVEAELHMAKSNLGKMRQQMDKSREESLVARQESARLRAELRVESIARQAAERQVKELEVLNRKLKAQLSQQNIMTKKIMEEALKLLSKASVGETDKPETPSAPEEPTTPVEASSMSDKDSSSKPSSPQETAKELLVRFDDPVLKVDSTDSAETLGDGIIYAGKNSLNGSRQASDRSQ